MLASYGIKFIAIGFILTVFSVYWATSRDSVAGFVASIVLAMLTIFLAFFYRNPGRVIPIDNTLILSNSDGTVLSVEDIENEFIGGPGKKVSIFLSVFNVHINRIPIDGKIEYIKNIQGKYIAAYDEMASDNNVQTEIGLLCGSGRIVFKQITGFLARRIECDVKEGDEVKAGDIYGMIHFGSRAEFFLPLNMDVIVKKGDKLKGGVSAVARIRK